MIPIRHRRFIEDTLEHYKVPKLPAGEAAHESLLAWSHSGGRSQVDVALGHPIKLIANALGTPPEDVVSKCHARDIKVAALIGTPEQAKRQVEAGVDIVIASGTEAGGHTGEISTFVLVPEVVEAVAPTPVLAAGGIGTGRQIAAALALGADGAWTGSVWLASSESDLHPVALEKVLKATSRDTVRSRSLSGKPARQLRTAWTDAWDGPDSPGTLPMPLQFMATAEAVSRIHRYAHVESSGARELVGTPIGQIVGSIKRVQPVREIVYEMVNECVDTLAKLGKMVDQ
jgi:NAD(P)H-dependent flavin oxidoreductase YrpB (nitropropane dioxygenase family)